MKLFDWQPGDKVLVTDNYGTQRGIARVATVRRDRGISVYLGSMVVGVQHVIFNGERMGGESPGLTPGFERWRIKWLSPQAVGLYEAQLARGLGGTQQERMDRIKDMLHGMELKDLDTIEKFVAGVKPYARKNHTT